MNKNIVPSENQNKNKRKLIKVEANDKKDRYDYLVGKFHILNKINSKIMKDDNKLK